MTVRRNFEAFYKCKVDPWNVKSTQQEYYRAILQFLSERISKKENLLDIGCGEGHLTSKLSAFGNTIKGIDVSKTAIFRAKENYPRIDFENIDIRKMDYKHSFDVVFCSEVLYYLSKTDMEKALSKISDSLKNEGIAFFSAWCPGGKYFHPEEFTKIIGKRFILEAFKDHKDHRMIIARKKGIDFLFTIDYETWQPIPPGYKIDWGTDILLPAEKLMSIAEKHGVPLTFMFETAEYLFLKKNEPEIAEKIEAQIKKAHHHKHDIQLHIHPSWLPELGAIKTGTNYEWKEKFYALKDYPYDLNALFHDHTLVLKELTDKEHKVTGFRANNYLIQPNEKIFEAMKKSGIVSDTSVWEGGINKIGFDFRGLNNGSQPYLASKKNILLPALDEENAILEAPILSMNGKRLTFNWTNSKKMSSLFEKFEKNIGQGVVNIVGHTKGKIDYDSFESFLNIMKEKDANFMTYSEIIKKYKKHAEIMNLCENQSIKRRGYEALPFGITSAAVVGVSDDLSKKNILVHVTDPKKISFSMPREKMPVDCFFFCNLTDEKDINKDTLLKAVNDNGCFILIFMESEKSNSFCEEMKGAFDNLRIEKISSKKMGSPFEYTFILVTGVKNFKPTSSLERAKSIMQWTYNKLSPELCHKSSNPVQILKEGYAWCEGYALVMEYICKKEGIKTRKTTLFAKNHEFGHGDQKVETHEVIEVKTDKGWTLFDPMANVCFNTELKNLISNPSTADNICRNIKKDSRWKKRKYGFYCSSYFYKKVFRIEKKAFVALPEFVKDFARNTGLINIKRFIFGKNIR